MGKINGNRKGKQFERDIANSLLHIFPRAERMLEYQASVVKGVDLQNTGEFDIQCKRNQAYAPVSKIKEILVKDPKRTPVLVTKGNNVPAMAILPWDKFVKIIERLGIGEKGEINSEIQIEANKTVPSLEYDDSIETEAIETHSGELYSTPTAKEKTLSHKEAVTKLDAIIGVPVGEKETVPEDRIMCFFDEGKIPFAAYFKAQWKKDSGAARLLTTLRKFEDDNGCELRAIFVRPEEGGEDIPEFLTIAENEDQYLMESLVEPILDKAKNVLVESCNKEKAEDNTSMVDAQPAIDYSSSLLGLSEPEEDKADNSTGYSFL